MSWEDQCVQLAQQTVDWFWAEFSADAYFSSAPDEVPPLQDRILWFALPADREGLDYAIEKLGKAAEWVRNAAGEIDTVSTGDLMVDWEGDAADSVKMYISKVKTSCSHLEKYIEALLVAAQAYKDRLCAIEGDVTSVIELAKNAVDTGNDISGQVASQIGAAVAALATGGAAPAAVALVSGALEAEGVKAFSQTLTGDGVYATRELKDALGKLRGHFATATESVGNALNGLANEVSQAYIPAEVDLPRVVQEPAFDPAQFRIDDPKYSHTDVSAAPLFPKKELIPGTEAERDRTHWGKARPGRQDPLPLPHPKPGS